MSGAPSNLLSKGRQDVDLALDQARLLAGDFVSVESVRLQMLQHPVEQQVRVFRRVVQDAESHVA